MVAVRSMHFNKIEKFNLKKWIANLKISRIESYERLVETCNFCLKIIQKLPDATLLLYRCIEMVEILSILNMDTDTLCAALLFPLIENKLVEGEEILNAGFDKTIITLIYGVRNITTTYQFNTNYTGSVSLKQMNDIHHALLTTVNDFRCIIIKLAERIIFLREIKNASEKKRIISAKECINIYVPLANRLGITKLKWELEDYCFRYLHPNEYKHIAKLLHERRVDRECYINKFVIDLRKSIKEKGIQAEVHGRPKHIYSIWRKMQKKHLTFDELFDIRAVRIIAEQLKYCYETLGIVHENFYHISDKFDDYIANPKPNGYQSIHTVILGPSSKTIEIQIRTKQMHKDAELGIAAHWKYKESAFIDMFSSHGKKNIITYVYAPIFLRSNTATEYRTILDNIRSQYSIYWIFILKK